MEKNRGSRIIAIVALVVAVTGLTLGFAAFSNTLTISSSAAVAPSNTDFKVEFSNKETTVEAGTVTGTPTAGATAASAEQPATLTGTTVSGLKANFTAPGQSVTYTFYAHNTGQYVAYLNNILFKNISDTVQKTKECTAVDPQNTTAGLVTAACDDISVKVNVGSTEATGSMDGIASHSLAKGGHETITVTIAYADNGNRADGDFNVAFGDISLIYGSAD